MRKAFIAAAAALAAGCFGGLREPVPQPVIYRVDAPRIAAGAPLAADLRVAVAAPHPVSAAAASRAAWPDRRLDYLAGARWAERLPVLIESALIESFQDSGRLRSVQGDAGRFRRRMRWSLELRRFEADYSAGGRPSPRCRSR